MGSERADIVIIGAGAAGLMACVQAGRAARAAGVPGARIVALDGAKKLGLKILVAGGGRCNVTHDVVTERDYAGGSKNAVRSVLARFGVEETIEFFAQLGVDLKREETGKLFPTTDRAQTVLDALLGAVDASGGEIRHPARVESVSRDGAGFIVSGNWGDLHARRVVLATGGMALPRTGSDGGGYALARALGHTVSRRVFPALVPLVLEEGSRLRDLSGLTVRAGLEVRSGSGKRLVAFTGSTLCTHFGLSGPGPMDISRHLTGALFDDAGAGLYLNWLPGMTRDEGEAALRGLGKRTVGRWLKERLPDRLADVLCAEAGVDTGAAGASLTRGARRGLLSAVFEMRLPVTGDRGFTHAEATAGGVPLEELAVRSMSSKRCGGLFLCGEICDVDGRIGGYNFQWAWSSGYIAGRSVVDSLLSCG